MTLQNVTSRFIKLSGLSANEAASWNELISDAYSDIMHRVRDDANIQQNAAALEAAAAALAFCNYRSVLSTRQDLKSFKAGDLSGEFGDGGVKEAYALFLRSLEPCALLFSDDDIIFGRVSSLCSGE